MYRVLKYIFCAFTMLILITCNKENKAVIKNLSAKEILGNPNYLAMSYGGYRYKNHDIEPTIAQLKEDMLLLAAMNVKIVRTYKVHLPQAANLLKAITELKKENPQFEMYVMLGAWIDCKNAWTDKKPNHEQESEANEAQINKAVRLAKKYPDIVKIIAVGNEAMVKWAETYYVQPNVILKWVNHLQNLKKEGVLSNDLWITSSDNFASWGGGEVRYHVKDLNKLIHAVDFISMHTYPMHDTHYNADFWKIPKQVKTKSKEEQINAIMNVALKYAQNQYNSVVKYMQSIGVNKPVHIGETGWASVSNGFYGANGSKAVDEYKQGLYYQKMREWTNQENISCFFFEGFDEPWKDANNPNGSENNFGLFTVDGKAKYAIWNLVDQQNFKDLQRDNNTIQKTYKGNLNELLNEVLLPETKKDTIQKQ